MNILITGGSGFLAGRLANHLSKNFNVWVCSNSLLQKPFWLKNCKFLYINWSDKNSVSEACKNKDLIIHTAGMNAQDCQLNPKRAFHINAELTKEILECAKTNEVKSFYYISTAHVYCNPLKGIIDEDNDVTNNHPYAASHALAERYLLRMIDKKEIKGSVIRLSNIYGMPAHKKVNIWSLLIQSLCKMSVQKGEVYLLNRKDVFRDFVGISEFLRFVEHLLIFEFEKIPSILNFGSGQTQSSSEIAKKIIKIVNLKFNRSLEFDDDGFQYLENTGNFRFNSKYLRQINYKVRDTFDHDVDKLLDFCVQNF